MIGKDLACPAGRECPAERGRRKGSAPGGSQFHPVCRLPEQADFRRGTATIIGILIHTARQVEIKALQARPGDLAPDQRDLDFPEHGRHVTPPFRADPVAKDFVRERLLAILRSEGEPDRTGRQSDQIAAQHAFDRPDCGARRDPHVGQGQIIRPEHFPSPIAIVQFTIGRLERDQPGLRQVPVRSEGETCAARPTAGVFHRARPSELRPVRRAFRMQQAGIQASIREVRS